MSGKHGDDSSQSQSLGECTGIVGQSGKNMCQGGKPDTGKFHSSYIGMNVCGSAYENGCVVDGTCVLRQRIEYYCNVIP